VAVVRAAYGYQPGQELWADPRWYSHLTLVGLPPGGSAE
ncbi:MAG: hypothetical protein JWP34_4700, partial [Massilia sp.]|nr:hypothetical protein [Massilia sp.]